MIELIPFTLPVGISLITLILIIIGFFVPPLLAFLTLNAIWIVGINLIVWGAYLGINFIINGINTITDNPVTLILVILLVGIALIIWKNRRKK